MKNLNNYNIILIGDSVTKGLCLKDCNIAKISNNAVDIIEKKYNTKINNISVFGQTLKRVYNKKIYLTALNDHIDNNKHNIVVLSLGGNDSDYDWDAVSKHPELLHDDKTPIKEFESILTKILTELKEYDVDIVCTTLFPIHSEQYFNRFISKKYNGNIILEYLNFDLSNLYRHQECFNNTITKVALQNGCRLLDIRTEALLKVDFLQYLSDDGIHPNEKGHQLIAELTTNFIENYNKK